MRIGHAHNAGKPGQGRHHACRVHPTRPTADAEQPTPTPISELNPVFEIKGKRHVMVTQALGVISSRELKRAVMSLSAQHDNIAKALDLLLVGL